MCVAEALLRIPDAETADALIRDKLRRRRLERRASRSRDWALMLTGTLAKWHDAEERNLPARLKRLVARLGEPVVRTAVRQAMRILAEPVRARRNHRGRGEARARAPAAIAFPSTCWARPRAPREDAASYLTSYTRAINAVRPPDALSIKLSALHPRFEEAKRDRVFSELLPRLRQLARHRRRSAASASPSTPKSRSASN